MEIEKAQIEHIDELILLNDEVQKIHLNLFPSFFKSTDKNELKEFFAKWLTQNDVKGFVALEDKKIIGYLFCRIVRREPYPFSKERHYIYIDQICISESKRMSGIGKALIQHVKELAKKLNIKRIELDYWTENAEAGKAFRAMGFNTYNEKMALDL